MEINFDIQSLKKVIKKNWKLIYDSNIIKYKEHIKILQNK